MEHPKEKLTFVGLWYGLPLWIETNDKDRAAKSLKELEKKLAPKPSK